MIGAFLSHDMNESLSSLIDEGELDPETLETEMGKSIARSKKRKFTGNRFTVAKKAANSEAAVSNEATTSSERKILAHVKQFNEDIDMKCFLDIAS